MNAQYSFPVWKTEGGGLATIERDYLKVIEKPAGIAYDVGDYIPVKQVTGPANILAMVFELPAR